MIIFLDAGGKILAASPETVGRNSNLATSIYIVAPFVSDTTVYLTFRLPNGEELFGGIAHEEEELPYEDAAQEAAYLFTVSGFSVWKYALPESVTLYAGTVQYTVVTLTESMRATATGTFLVSKGNRLIFPDAEPENAWELLMTAVKALENTLYDAGELPPELGANSLAERVAKAENALEGKLDKITDVAQTGNFGGAYVLKPDGTQGMMKITNTVGAGTIPMRGSGGVIVIGEPTDDSHAATKRYVDEGLAKKVSAKVFSGGLSRVYAARINDPDAYYYISAKPLIESIPVYASMRYDSYNEAPDNKATLLVSTPEKPYHCANKKYVDDKGIAIEKRLDLLELAAEGNIFAFVEDDSAAYEKAVPATAFPNATIDKLGGAALLDFYGFPKGYVSISNPNEDLTISYNAATGTFTYSGLLANQTTIVLLDESTPLPLPAGSYTFDVGSSWSIWNVTVVAYKDGSIVLWASSEESGYGDGSVSFTLDRDVDYIDVTIYDIGAIGPVEGLTLTPALVWNDAADNNELKKSPVTAIEIHGKNLFDESAITQAANSQLGQTTTYGVVENGYLKALHGIYNTAVVWIPFKMNLSVGKYAVSADVYVGNAPNLKGQFGLSQGKGSTNQKTKSFECSAYGVWERKSVTVEVTEAGEYYFCGCGVGGASNYNNLDVRFKNIQVEKATSATTFSPYRDPVTVFEVPQSIRNLAGYGLGIDKNANNYIDFENKTFVQMVSERDYMIGDTSGGEKLTDGKTTIYLLERPIITDISDKLTFDGNIEVEQNGAIVAVNEYKAAIPSTITFQVKL